MNDTAKYCPACGRKLESSLNPASVVAIRADPRPTREIALDYGVTKATINLIKRRVTWKHV
jgi:hypothetical protein